MRSKAKKKCRTKAKHRDFLRENLSGIMGQTIEWTKKEKKKKERFRDTNESVVFKKYFVNFYLIISEG